MGYYAKTLSMVIRGTRGTAWKERLEAKKAIRKLRKGAKEWERARELISEHRVTPAQRKLRKALADLDVASHKADAFIFNVLTQDKALVQTEQRILQALVELSQATGNNPALLKIERSLALAILNGTKYDRYAEPGERKEYQQVMLVLNEAKGNRNKFMASLRLMFKDEDTVSMFSTIPMAKVATIKKAPSTIRIIL